MDYEKYIERLKDGNSRIFVTDSLMLCPPRPRKRVT